MTLKSHPGMGLKLHEKKDHFGGHDVLWATLCDANEAMTMLKRPAEGGEKRNTTYEEVPEEDFS
jgi:hypothetical protein